MNVKIGLQVQAGHELRHTAKKKRYTKKPKHVTGSMFAQTTHVVTVPHGFVCVIKPTT